MQSAAIPPIKKIIGLALFVICACTVVATIGTVCYYYAQMPQTPQPQIGKVYPVTAAYGVRVYVSKGEFDWLNFVHYDLGVAAPLCGLLLVFLKLRLKWF